MTDRIEPTESLITDLDNVILTLSNQGLTGSVKRINNAIDRLREQKAEIAELHAEAWLYQNGEAILAVTEGLQQAKDGKLSEGPDLDEALAFAESLEDE